MLYHKKYKYLFALTKIDPNDIKHHLMNNTYFLFLKMISHASGNLKLNTKLKIYNLY